MNDGNDRDDESIRLTWPEATVQTCVVHMVRNSLRYASRKHWKQITTAMREIYTAPTVEAAEPASQTSPRNGKRRVLR